MFAFDVHGRKYGGFYKNGQPLNTFWCTPLLASPKATRSVMRGDNRVALGDAKSSVCRGVDGSRTMVGMTKTATTVALKQTKKGSPKPDCLHFIVKTKD
ncbi:MAG: hypothetical protein K9J37_06300 [Saprospiraceae bacterium]|nr:hypothetical protein [Saprospiraceae bacterium]MCF8249503.1 hypothetical protein [Saprospiraceae bacterium]MCF8280128.1 hypothetical protein [Bacteroidales bacterium]MCF8310721.1 hypothetical protein [Saprospiraceae bacterium]MCF8439448.1 hypothetical protein [Saprospiraceae bacterium]